MNEIPPDFAIPAATPPDASFSNEHDRATWEEATRRIAALAGAVPAGEPGWMRWPAGGGDYFVPRDTLLVEEARALGITRDTQFFGGAVPHRFVASKAISHGLISADARAPEGWQAGLAVHLGNAVLRGYTAFAVEDARIAGRLMLKHGPARLKEVEATSGQGQTVVASEQELEAALAAIDPARIEAGGLVIEENLCEVETYSVGTIGLPGRRDAPSASALRSFAYWGTQRLTRNNRGEAAYGGSRLHVVRGGFEELQRELLSHDRAEAVRKALLYDRAVFAAYPALFASRRNYDVAEGTDAGGRIRIGVLEQSWRIGGATGAEIAACEYLEAHPEKAGVTCATVEIYGNPHAAPPDAAVYYAGVDPVAGPLTKYAQIIE
ncbi:MAG: hypothetical protein K0R64_2859 [Novosphingobium lindaniclasticum]|uniref:DUF3182 family protein n=1 Tax=Novosphingobium lindaniclasticum TaxID=1329895 RepID=UPI00240A45CB|nr:DUF3182 family protein [Novosphingobium lindaniclasticum]MDF2639875.1 hypothetical protein [Novosphingobium lindaniclasticum]